ncbi:hypothetical protein RFI_25146, partial [Reticulomyxa filosa]
TTTTTTTNNNSNMRNLPTVMQEVGQGNAPTYVGLKPENEKSKIAMGVDPKAFYNLHSSRTSKIHFSMDDEVHFESDKDNDSAGSIPKTRLQFPRESEDDFSIDHANKGKLDEDSDEGSEELDFGDGEAKEMMNEMVTLARRMTTNVTGNDGGDSANNDGLMNHMWNSFLSFRQAMEKPPNAPSVYKVQDSSHGFTALRDLLDAFPSELAQPIFEEQ